MPTDTRQNQSRLEPPIRGARVAKGMGLAETARAAGLDPGHLSKFERGQAGMSVDNLARLARVLGLKEMSKLLAPYARREGS